MEVSLSVNKIPIRLTDERWSHITIGHPEVAAYYDELLETIHSPDIIYEGTNGGLIAIKQIQNITDKFVGVIYKEVSDTDGFILTAYISNQKQKFEKRKIIWKRELK